jgi:diacylglycerol kinase
MMTMFYVATKGFFEALRTERNLQFHCIALLVVFMAGFYFGITNMEWVAIVLCYITVISAELLNTAIEKLCDALHPAQHPAIGKVKDIAAASVLVTALGSAIVGAIVFWPYVKAAITFP